MKPRNQKHNFIENFTAILIGIISALLSILFLTGIFQALIALIFGITDFHFGFNYFIFKPIFHLQNNGSAIAFGIIYFAPFVFNILMLEIGTALLKKSILGQKRFSLIFFNLVIALYLIISVFYGAVISLLVINSINDWNQLMIHLKIVNSGKIMFMFVIIIMLTTYLKRKATRILEYIN